jgi:hypothetical protein
MRAARLHVRQRSLHLAMARFILLLAAAVALAAAAIIGTAWANVHFGFLPTKTDADRLELMKLLPATLAVVAGIFTAAVSVLSVRLQREAASRIEALKTDFQKDLERFRRRLGLVGADAEKARQTIERLRSAASSYHAELKRLETGNFSPNKMSETEKAAEALGGEIPRDASYLEAWYRFCQQGYCMSDLAKRRNSIPERKSLWKEEGRLLGDQFENLIEQLRREEALIRERELASDKGDA